MRLRSCAAASSKDSEKEIAETTFRAREYFSQIYIDIREPYDIRYGSRNVIQLTIKRR